MVPSLFIKAYQGLPKAIPLPILHRLQFNLVKLSLSGRFPTVSCMHILKSNQENNAILVQQASTMSGWRQICFYLIYIKQPPFLRLSFVDFLWLPLAPPIHGTGSVRREPPFRAAVSIGRAEALRLGQRWDSRLQLRLLAGSCASCVWQRHWSQLVLPKRPWGSTEMWSFP